MIHSLDDQTIIAHCTPRGSGAIALLRISGLNAITIADVIGNVASGKKLADLPTHTIHYGTIQDAHGAALDQVMFLLMRGPKTFTGQDTVEITCHNNQFIIEQIMSIAIAHGARVAQEGEFSKRAVLNGKIDLVQAEAIKELIHAQTQLALKQSLSQLTGSFSYWISTIEQQLLKALALSEASFEFLDEEMEFAPQIQEIIESVTATIASIKKTFSQQQHIRQGIRIAIIGAVNAGKSSLFNALLNQERAIVTAIAGTTRDVIEAGLYKNGNFWTLVDTAGLRQTHDEIEREGIKRSFQEAQKADIIILAYDGGRAMSEQEIAVYEQLHAQYEHKIITVFTKMDELSNKATNDVKWASPSIRSFGTTQDVYTLNINELNQQAIPPSHILPFDLAQDKIHSHRLRIEGQANNVIKEHNQQNVIHLSSKTKENIDTLEKLIEQKIAALFAGIESPFLLNQRHYNLLLALETKLEEIQQMLAAKKVAYELLSIHLNDALAHLAQLSGKSISEAGMDMVFREFCIGK